MIVIEMDDDNYIMRVYDRGTGKDVDYAISYCVMKKIGQNYAPIDYSKIIITEEMLGGERDFGRDSQGRLNSPKERHYLDSLEPEYEGVEEE